MDLVVAAAEDILPDWYADALWLLRCTGLRNSQVMRLEWRDVDLEGRWLTIRGELGKTRAERRGRVVPMPEHLVDWLAGRGRRDGWLVAPHLRRRYAPPHEVERAWRHAGLPEHLFRGRHQGHQVHAFRRGYESALLASGAPYRAVEYLVGHAMPGAGMAYVDPRWALPLQEAVARVPERTGVASLDAARRSR